MKNLIKLAIKIGILLAIFLIMDPVIMLVTGYEKDTIELANAAAGVYRILFGALFCSLITKKE